MEYLYILDQILSRAGCQKIYIFLVSIKFIQYQWVSENYVFSVLYSNTTTNLVFVQNSQLFNKDVGF